MNTLQIKVQNKVASYIVRCGAIVCGNSDYQLQFIFDAEWAEYEKKTARFEYNGQYHDVEFEGDTCPVPVISNADQCSVGVYVGEDPEDDAILSSTRTQIPCQRSIRCGTPNPAPTTGEHYTNEARGYANRAKKAAEQAEVVAEQAKTAAEQAEEATAQLETYKGMEQIGSLSIKAVLGYDDQGMEESQIGGVGIMDGILPLYAEYGTIDFLIVNTYKDAIKGIFENARVVELTIDKNNSHVPVENPVHKEMCKGGHMWYGTPKLIEDDMYGEVIGLGVNDLNDGTHLVYAVDVEDSEHTELLGLALSKGALLRINDVIYYSGSGEEVTLNFTAYR